MTEENLNTYPLRLVPLASLLAHPDNPRDNLGDLVDLANSIKAQGILQPLVAVPSNGSGPSEDGIQGNTDALYLIAGHRRAEAARKAGLEVVPVIIRDDLTPANQVEVMLVENVQRADLAPVEQAKALQRLVDLGLSQREVASRTGIAQGTVSKRLSLLALPVSVAKQVDSGGIAVNDAVALSKVAGDKVVIDAASKFVSQGMDAKRAIEQAQASKRKAEAAAKSEAKAKALGAEKPPQGKETHNLPPVAEKDAKSHAGHLWYVIKSWDGSLALYCGKPRSHPKPKSEQAAAEKAKAAKAEAQAARLAGQAARREAARKWLGKADARKCADLMTWFLTFAYGYGQPHFAGLYSDPKFSTLDWSDALLSLKYDEDATLLTKTKSRAAVVNGKPVEQARAAAAVVLARLESDLSYKTASENHVPQGDAVRRYCDLIGYRLSEWEAKAVPDERSLEDKAESVVARAEAAMDAEDQVVSVEPAEVVKVEDLDDEDEAASGVEDALGGIGSDGDAGL